MHNKKKISKGIYKRKYTTQNRHRDKESDLKRMNRQEKMQDQIQRHPNPTSVSFRLDCHGNKCAIKKNAHRANYTYLKKEYHLI